MRSFLPRFIYIIAIFFIINSCIKEDFSVSKLDVKNYKPGLAIPLINANLSLNDLSAIDSVGWNLREDVSKFITLVYLKTETLDAQTFLKISDQTLNKNYTFSVDNSLPPGDSLSETYNSSINFESPDGDIFDLIHVKTGTLEININSDLNMRGKMKFSLPDVTKNGQMLTSQFSYNGQPINMVIDISDYVVNFFHVGNSNRLLIEFDVTAYNEGLLNLSPYNINLDISLKNIRFSKVFGYFSSRSFSFADHLRVSLFGGLVAGSSYFEDPKLHLHFLNSVGIPVNLHINSFTAHSDITPPYNVNITGLPNPIYIAAPVSPGSSVKQEYLLNKSNSNIKDAINMVPSAFDYDITGVTVPDKTFQNFIFDTSKINLDVEIELPLYGRIQNYILSDTFDFTIENLDMIESVKFNLLAGNGFPLDAMVQIYFLDEQGNMLDSLFVLPRDYLRSAIVDIPTGRVIKPVYHLYEIEFDRDRLEMIQACKYLNVSSTFSTSNKGLTSVKIYSDYKMDIKFSALAKPKI